MMFKMFIYSICMFFIIRKVPFFHLRNNCTLNLNESKTSNQSYVVCAGFCNSYSRSCGDSSSGGKFWSRADTSGHKSTASDSKETSNKFLLDKENLKLKLTPLQFRITQEADTEMVAYNYKQY